MRWFQERRRHAREDMNQRVYVAEEVSACRVASASEEMPPPVDMIKGQRVDAEDREA